MLIAIIFTTSCYLRRNYINGIISIKSNIEIQRNELKIFNEILNENSKERYK